MPPETPALTAETPPASTPITPTATDAPPPAASDATPPPPALADQLPPELRAEFARYDTSTELATGYKELRAQFNRADTVQIPGSDAPREVLDAFHTKLGRPDTAADYALPDLPEGMATPVPEELLTSFREKAHEVGLSSHAAAELFSWWTNQTATMEQGTTKHAADSIIENNALLQKEWGGAYEEKINFSRNALQFADNKANAEYYAAAKARGETVETVTEMLETTGLGSHPGLVRIFEVFGSMIADDPLHRGPGPRQQFALSPGEAQAQIDAYEATHAQAMIDTRHPEHKVVTAHLRHLYEQTHPEPSGDYDPAV